MSTTCLITLCDGKMWVRILVHKSLANEIQPYYNSTPSTCILC